MIRLAYIGNAGRTYDLATLIAAVGSDPELTLDIAGSATGVSTERIRYHGYLSGGALSEVLGACDVGVIPMSADSFVGIPNKLADYARARLRVVSSLRGECAELIGRFGLGEAYAPGSAESLRTAVRSAMDREPDFDGLLALLDSGRIYADYAARVLALDGVGEQPVVWIQNPFDNLPGEGERPQRYAMMSAAFRARGAEVVLFTSDFSHALKSPRRAEEENSVVFIPTKPYRGNVSFARIVSHVLYGCAWWRLATDDVEKGDLPRPTVIVSSIPTVSGARTALRLARRFGCVSVIDVQDAWPETFVRLFPRLLRPLAALAFLPIRLAVRMIYRRATLVTGVCDRYAALVGRPDYYRAYLGI